MTFIYNSRGNAVAFIAGKYIYDIHGRGVGQIRDDHVYRVNGEYVGELHRDMIVDKGYVRGAIGASAPGVRGAPGQPGVRGVTVPAWPEISGKLLSHT